MIVYDLKGTAHNKEPVDVRECVEIMGWTTVKPVKKRTRKKIVKPEIIIDGVSN